MTHGARTQLTLTIVVLILTTAALLFGWVYATTIQNKLNSLVLSPLLDSKETSATLKESNNQLYSRLTALEAEIINLKSQLAQSGIHATSASAPTEVNTEIDHPGKREIFVDEKCFSDPANLNECAVFAVTQLSATTKVIVKPGSEITEGVNDVIFEFYNSETKVTELKISTTQLLNTKEAIATIAFLQKNDITVQTKVGLNSTNAIFNYDGSDWIDLTSYGN